jgi:hypothetical protein
MMWFKKKRWGGDYRVVAETKNDASTSYIVEELKMLGMGGGEFMEVARFSSEQKAIDAAQLRWRDRVHRRAAIAE